MDVADFREKSVKQRYFDQLILVIDILFRNAPDTSRKEGQDFMELIQDSPDGLIRLVPDKELLREYLDIDTESPSQDIIVKYFIDPLKQAKDRLDTVLGEMFDANRTSMKIKFPL